ncbi:MAG: adenylosuccinate synthetase, partial [Halobacteriota archaeon]
MPATIIVGGFWGDEGKGKIVSHIAFTEEPKIIARGGVGPNAGHTVEFKGEKYGVRMVPSGFVYENALCCGGCAGKLWQETKKGERFSDIRVQQALDAGANVLAVGCPYCRLNFEDSLLTSGSEGAIEVKDVV